MVFVIEEHIFQKFEFPNTLNIIRGREHSYDHDPGLLDLLAVFESSGTLPASFSSDS